MSIFTLLVALATVPTGVFRIMIARENITGAILAGGQARRMGGADKGLMALQGKPLLTYVIDTLTPQVGTLMINANRNLDQYKALGYPIIQDTVSGQPGPLAGIASALLAAKTDHVLVVPCDSPYLPHDLAARLATALTQEHAEVAVAHDGTRIQPVVALLQRDLAEDILQSIYRGHNKTERWMTSRRLAVADFSDKPLAFKNINTPDDM